MHLSQKLHDRSHAVPFNTHTHTHLHSHMHTLHTFAYAYMYTCAYTSTWQPIPISGMVERQSEFIVSIFTHIEMQMHVVE
mgnify:FL=1